jgi:hypothetical protein
VLVRDLECSNFKHVVVLENSTGTFFSLVSLPARSLRPPIRSSSVVQVHDATPFHQGGSAAQVIKTGACIDTQPLIEAPARHGTTTAPPDLDAHVALPAVPPGLEATSDQEVEGVWTHLYNELSQMCARLCQTAVAGLSSTVRQLTQAAFLANSQVTERRDALLWAENYQFPQDIHERDELRLAAVHGDFTSMVASLQTDQRPSRFSRERVLAMVPPSDPDFNYLLTLADGMTIFMPKSFKQRVEPMKIRKLYSELRSPINKLLFKQWSSEKCFIIRTSVAASILGLHYSPIHWCKSKDKLEGRQLYDFTDDTDGGALNSKEVKEWGQLHIGPIRHPTLNSLVYMVRDFWLRESAIDPSLTWDDLIICKMDLKGAFNLLNFKADHVKYTAAALTGDLTILQHVGGFGYANLPAYFDHISKVLVRLLRVTMKGALDMYVDDLMFITRRSWLLQEQAIVIEVVTGLLGPTAVAHDKTFAEVKLDWIGWQFDLSTQTVCMAQHCFLKAVYYFFSVDVDSPVTVLQMQQLGSLAVRYAEICTVMRPYSKAIWKPLAGRNLSNSTISLDPTTKRAIWMWRMMFLLLQWDRTAMSRPFRSFIPHSNPDFLLVSDASLTGIGGEIFDLRSGAPVLLGVLREQFPLDFNFDESSYQNLAEFIGILTLVLALVEAGARGHSILLRGDSKTALKWAKSQTYSRADRNNGASLLYTMVMVQFDLRIHATEFINSKANHLCDALSRGTDMKGYGAMYNDLDNYYQWTPESIVSRAVHRCNPRQVDDGSTDYALDMMVFFKGILEELRAQTPKTHPTQREARHPPLT